MENAKIEKLNWDIMCDFQTMWFHFTWATIRQHANWIWLVNFQNYWVLFTLTVKNLEDFPLPLRFNELFWPKKNKKVEWNIGYLMLGKSLHSAPKVLGCTWCISCLFSPMLVWVFAGDLGWKALNFFFILQLAYLAIHFFCKTCKLRNPFYER